MFVQNGRLICSNLFAPEIMGSSGPVANLKITMEINTTCENI